MELEANEVPALALDKAKAVAQCTINTTRRSFNIIHYDYECCVMGRDLYLTQGE
tara:strand:- start:111 stop:272 length:162 start_codon:yes stop_codon:yes gene_type:complete